MIEEDVAIARWGLAAMLLFASLLTAAFLCWLREQDIHPFKPILKFLRRPLGEVLIVLVCVRRSGAAWRDEGLFRRSEDDGVS